MLSMAKQAEGNIIAVDVGVNIGIATRIGGQYATCVAQDPAYLWELLTQYPWEVVVYEQFATAGLISKYGLHTTRIVGGIQALCWYLKIDMEPHPPQWRKAFIERSRQIHRKWHREYTDHEVDALAHLLHCEDRRNRRARREESPNTNQ